MLKPQLYATRPTFLKLGVVILLGLLSAHADTRLIRLRHATITTPQSFHDDLAQLQRLETNLSGLYLIQFTGHFQSIWREQLGNEQVELLNYVPDDAFVARLRQVQLNHVRNLPFVRWIGEYRADFKLHPQLKISANSPVNASLLAIRVLMTKDASPEDLLQTRRSMDGAVRASRWRFGTIVEGQVNPKKLVEIAQSPFVLWIEAATYPKMLDEIATKIVGGQNSTNGHASAAQQLGFDGAGVTVAVADSGLNNGDPATMHPDLVGRIDGFFYYGALTNAADQHGHGTHNSGIIAGNGATGKTDPLGALYGLGVAPGAHLLAQRIFDDKGNYRAPASNEVLTQDAVRGGAVIGSNSWGDETQGRYDLHAAEFDSLVRDADADRPDDQPFILIFAAGNAGPGRQTIGSPATAKNVIATGASENDRASLGLYMDGPDIDGPNKMAGFSSRGPCEDGRIKPDLVAPGTWIASLQSASAGAQYARLPISAFYQYQQGTSQAGSHVAGAAAVFVQYYRQTHTNATPSPALVKAALINSATPLAFPNAPVPNQDEGWGRVDLTPLITPARRYDFIDQTILLSTGQIYEHSIKVASSSQPLKITLAYTDVPGLPAAIPALVNDLDLEVVGPDGILYRGNQFDNGESMPDAPASDNLNNVEAVQLSHPVAGDYLVRVRAMNVADDARNDTAAIDQDFGLVTSGDLSVAASRGLSMDQPAYTVPALIRLKLLDYNLSGQTTVVVTVRSTTQTNGLSILLRHTDATGIYTGSVATAAGPADFDGRLHINQGDQIEAVYTNNTTGGTQSATARAQITPPTITGVAANNQYDKVIITWQTDEPATSLVRYGTNSSLINGITNATLNQNHQITLPSLPLGVTNWFIVISTDNAGNTRTNDNQGKFFQIVRTPTATVLLVDAYQSDGISQDIPASAYLDTLDQAKIDYKVWNVPMLGRFPTVDDLRPFRVVMWRINDSLYSSSGILPPQQATLQSYLLGGGSFFLASMEILSRLEGSSFRTNVLHVQSFQADVGLPSVAGIGNDPITSGFSADLDFSAFPRVELLNLGPDMSDTITPAADAAPILVQDMSDPIVGLRFPRTGQDGMGRVVFLSFPWEALPATNTSAYNRVGLLRNILGFLAPDVYPSGMIVLDHTTYTIPARVIVEVTDNNRVGSGKAAVKFFSNSDTNGQPITIYETVRRGLFRGFITLTASTNAASPGQLRASNGEQIWADYLETSTNKPVRAVATIDVLAPVVAGIQTQSDYVQVMISWNTSKPADSLVQFGESTFLGGTAYQPDLVMSHVLSISGLIPDHTYVYQVASRDAAGNTTVDDNQGQLYSIHTLPTMLLPWQESLDTGVTNWTVVNSTPGGAAWQLGIPHNGREVSAHSPPNAWGSDLAGAPIDSADTTLLSPDIYLAGGQFASLRFWHSYAFATSSDSVITEFGRLLISTNSGSTWLTLAAYSNASDGWEKAEADLTPYMGQVIRIGWNYDFLALDALPRPGWLVDDISITVNNQPHGMIAVSNNLSQAAFTLSGPLSLSGQGWNSTITNAPLGQYIVVFKPVPYYQTPPPQTNTLTSTSLLGFQGNYLMVDTNHNGISDAWEQYYFGKVTTPFAAAMDSDGDGASAYAEFMAGTDPTNALSRLALYPPTRLTNGMVLLEWSSVAGHAYRVDTSTNGLTWLPTSDWICANGIRTSWQTPVMTRNGYNFFRLEVRP